MGLMRMTFVMFLLCAWFLLPVLAGEPAQRHAKGWVKDSPEGWIFNRDVHFAVGAPIVLPSKVDLRPNCGPVEDQGQLGACTTFSSGGAFNYIEHQEGNPFCPVSHLKIYYDVRKLEGTLGQDSGAQIRDVVKNLCTPLGGACPEPLWPYVISKFNQKPPAICYSFAKTNYVLQAQSVAQTSNAIDTALAKGLPVIFGFTVYSSFESQAVANTGIMPMPRTGEQVLGGHAVLIVGYDYAKDWYIVRNSWSAAWGDQGYFYMPRKFALNKRYASDFWVLLKTMK